MLIWNGWQLLFLGVLIPNIAANHLSGRESSVLRGIRQELSFPSPSSDFRFRFPQFPETRSPLRRTLRFPGVGSSTPFRISPFQQQQQSLFGGQEFLTQGRQLLTQDLQTQGRQFLRPDFQQPTLRGQFLTQGFQHMPQGGQVLPSGALSLLAGGASQRILDTSSSLGIPTARRIRIPTQFSVTGRTPSVLDRQLVSQPVALSRRVLSTRGSGPIDILAALRERLERTYGGIATGTGTRDDPIRIRASVSSRASLGALQPHIRQTVNSPVQRSPVSLTRQQATQGRRVQLTRTQQVPQTGRHDDQILALFGFDPTPTSHGTDPQAVGLVPELSGSGHQESGIVPELSGTGHHSSSSMLLETGHHVSGGLPEMSETVDKRASVQRVPIKKSPVSSQMDPVLSEGIGSGNKITATGIVSHTDGLHVSALDLTKSTDGFQTTSHTDITADVQASGKSLHSDVTVDAAGSVAVASSVDVTAVQDPTQVITKPASTAEVSILGPEVPVQTSTDILAKVSADVASHTIAVPKKETATQSIVQDITTSVQDSVVSADVTTPGVIISTDVTVTAETPEPPEPTEAAV